MKSLVLAATVVAAVAVVVSSPADAGRRDGLTNPSDARAQVRVETEAQCIARQMKIRDPVSGIRIQAGDAQRFCGRQRR